MKRNSIKNLDVNCAAGASESWRSVTGAMERGLCVKRTMEIVKMEEAEKEEDRKSDRGDK